MPGFMGIRGINLTNPHDTERRRREDRRVSNEERERRAEEKAQEILREQQGDMSEHTGDMPVDTGKEHRQTANFMVGEIMSGKVAVLGFDDNLLTVEGIFSKVKFRHLPVVEEDGTLIGILSDRDFLRTVSPFFGTVNEQTRDKEVMLRKVGTIMTRNPICANINTRIIHVIQMMNSNKISCLPIVEQGTMRLIGIVTWKDIVRAFCPKAFGPSRDSARLKTGVRLNPQLSESEKARVIAEAEEAAATAAEAEPESVSGTSDSGTKALPRPEASGVSDAVPDAPHDGSSSGSGLADAPDMPAEAEASAALAALSDAVSATASSEPSAQPPENPESDAKNTLKETAEKAEGDAGAESEAETAEKPAPGKSSGSRAIEVAPPRSEALERKLRGERSETDIFALPPHPGSGGDMLIAASEKLPDRRTAGQAGSELAARQRLLLREQLERTTDSSRLRALRDEQRHRKE